VLCTLQCRGGRRNSIQAVRAAHPSKFNSRHFKDSNAALKIDPELAEIAPPGEESHSAPVDNLPFAAWLIEGTIASWPGREGGAPNRGKSLLAQNNGFAKKNERRNIAGRRQSVLTAT